MVKTYVEGVADGAVDLHIAVLREALRTGQFIPAWMDQLMERFTDAKREDALEASGHWMSGAHERSLADDCAQVDAEWERHLERR